MRRFVEAPENVRKQYQIDTSSALSNFTWLRVLIKAVKPALPIIEP
jgi:hypothetical protein